MEGFYKTYFDIIRGVEDSLEKERIIPSLILIYSAIDSYSHLTEKSSKKGGKVFKAWVKKWMLSTYPLPVNEIDIYAARCGLLHEQVSGSDLSSKGKAKEIYYCWGNSKTEKLEKAISKSDKKDQAVAVKVEDLFWSFRKGFVDCKNEIHNDEDWEKRFKEKAKKLFINIPNQ